MPNKNYQRGRRFEYSIIERLKKQGYDIVQRSKGSHSPIDIFAIDIKNKKIKFIQAKKGFISEKSKEKIREDNKNLIGSFEIEFEVIN